MATSIVVRFIGDNTSLQRAFAQTSAGITRIRSQSTGLAGTITGVGGSIASLARSAATFTVPIAIGLGAAAKSAVDYEDSISKISRLADVSGKQAAAWSTQIMNLSKSVAIGPKELADALYFVASSGAPVSKAMDIIKSSAKGATAGLGDVQKIADALTTTVNVYGEKNITAAKAADILTAAVREGKGEATEYVKTIGRITPVAKLLGVNFADVAGAMAAVTNRGLSTSEAATGIRQALIALIKPSQAAVKYAEEQGTSYDKLRQTMKEKGLLAALREMQDLTHGNREAMAKLFPNVRGLNAALILMDKDGAGAIDKTFRNVANSTGALDRAFDKAGQTSKVKFAQGLANLKRVGIEVGAQVIPALVKLSEWFGKVVDWFERLSPSTRKWIVIGAMAAVGLTVLGLAVGALATAIGVLLSPITLVVAAIAGLAYGAVWLYKNWTPFREVVNSVWSTMRDFGSWLGDTFTKIWNALPNAITTAKNAIVGVWHDMVAVFDDPGSAHGEGIKRMFQDIAAIAKGVWTFISAVGGAIWSVLSWIGGIMMNFWDRIRTPFVDAFKRIWDFIASIFKAAWKIIQGIWEVVSGIFEGDWGRVWTGIKNVFGGIWDAIVAVLKLAWNTISFIIGAGMAAISFIWSYVWGAIKTVVTGVWDAIVAVIRGAWNFIKNDIGGAVGWVWGKIVSVFNSVKDFIVGTWDGIVDFFKKLPGRISNAASGLWDGLMSGLKTAVNWIIDKINGLVGGLNKLTNWIPGIGDDLQIPKIPKLASGGIITRPTLAIVGEGGAPEVVFPTNDPRRGYDMLRRAGVPSESGSGSVVYKTYITATDPVAAAAAWQREAHWNHKTSGR